MAFVVMAGLLATLLFFVVIMLVSVGR